MCRVYNSWVVGLVKDFLVMCSLVFSIYYGWESRKFIGIRGLGGLGWNIVFVYDKVMVFMNIW